MKLSDIFHSFSSRIASLKSQGKAGEVRALILQRTQEVEASTEAAPPVAAAPAPSPVAPPVAAKPAPTPVVVDHFATISALNTRLVTMEKEFSALKSENATLKAAAVAPPAAKPVAPSKVALAEAALTSVKESKAKGEATSKEVVAAAFNLTEAKRQEKADAGKRPVTYTAEDAAKLSHHDKELRLAHLAHAFDQCNTPQGRNALWTIHRDEICTLTAGPLAGWMISFRTS